MNMKVLVVKLTSDKHTVLIMKILKKNKDLKSKFEMKEHNLITNFFPMETKGISCVENICDLEGWLFIPSQLYSISWVSSLYILTDCAIFSGIEVVWTVAHMV